LELQKQKKAGTEPRSITSITSRNPQRPLHSILQLSAKKEKQKTENRAGNPRGNMESWRNEW